MKSYFKFFYLFTILSVFFLTSCTEEEQEPSIVTGLTFDSQTFYANKAKWEENKPENYEFSYDLFKPVSERSLQFERGVRVTSVVKNGEWDSFKYETESGEVSFDSLKEYEKQHLNSFNIKTIDEYISRIEKSVEYYSSFEQDYFKTNCIIKYEYKVLYDSEYFFPHETHLHREYGKEMSLLSDSVYFSGIIDFKVLPAEQVN